MNRADDEAGGSLRAAINTADAMAAAGIQVTFTAPVHRSVTTLRAVSSMHPLVTVKLFPAGRLSARFGASGRHLLWLIWNVRRFDFVHIHTVFYLGALYAALISFLCRVPYFVWPHGSLDRYDLHKHHRVKSILGPSVFSWYLRGARALLCTTTREAEELVVFGASTTREVVPLPVAALRADTVERDAWRESHGIPTDSFVVLFLGRIDPKKGLDRLIDAMVDLWDSNVRLVIAGVGDDRSAITAARAQVDRLRLADVVHFTGWIEGDERLGAFTASDVFVLPSDNENFGIAVVEALLMALPVIVSEKVYISDDLLRVDGALVVGRSPANISAAIRSVMSDVELAAERAARGRKFAIGMYSPAAVASRIVSVAFRSPGGA